MLKASNYAQSYGYNVCLPIHIIIYMTGMQLYYIICKQPEGSQMEALASYILIYTTDAILLPPLLVNSSILAGCSNSSVLLQLNKAML